MGRELFRYKINKKLVGEILFSLLLDIGISHTPELDFIRTSHFAHGCQHPNLAKTSGHVLNFDVTGTPT